MKANVLEFYTTKTGLVEKIANTGVVCFKEGLSSEYRTSGERGFLHLALLG